MSFHRGSRHSHQNHVKFVDEDVQAFDDYRTNYVSKTESVDTYGGPRFPNLQMMFKHKEAEDGLYNQVDNVKLMEDKVVHRSTHTTTIVEEDIDMEAGEFIKRKHHNLSLQKLKSIAA